MASSQPEALVVAVDAASSGIGRTVRLWERGGGPQQMVAGEGPNREIGGLTRVPRRIGRGDGRTAVRVGRRRVNDGKPANGSRRRRVPQSPAEQSVAGAGRAPAKQGARGRAAHEGRGEGSGRRITGGFAGGRTNGGAV